MYNITIPSYNRVGILVIRHNPIRYLGMWQNIHEGLYAWLGLSERIVGGTRLVTLLKSRSSNFKEGESSPHFVQVQC